MKNEVEQKEARLQIWKYNKNRYLSNVFFTDDFSFYLRSSGINRWSIKMEITMLKNANIQKKDSRMGSILK